MQMRHFRSVLAGGASAVVVVLLALVFGNFRRPAGSGGGEGSASGSSRSFTESTNKVALAREIAKRGDSSAVPGLIVGLRSDPNPLVRAACAEALGRIGDKRSRPDLALCLASETEPAVRQAAAAAFEASGMHRDFGHFDVLRKRLADDKSPLVRRDIAGILGRLGTDMAMDALAVAASDEDPGVRLAVVRAFVGSRHEAAGDLLARAAIDPDEAVRVEAAAAVHGAGTVLLPRLREAVAAAKDTKSRLAVVRMLPRPVAPEAVPILFSALESETAEATNRNPALFDAVVDALAGMGPDGARVVAKEAIAQEYAGVAEAAAAQACLRIGPPAARAVTEEIMKWRLFPDPAELALWVETLGKIGDPCAAPVLRRALAQGLPEMPAIVEKARCAIAAKSGESLPAIEPEPGLLADAPAGPIRRLRQGDMRFAEIESKSAAVPTNGVLRLRLVGAVTQPDPPDHPGRDDMDAELVRRDGTWDKRFLVMAFYNKRDHEGFLVETRETADECAFVFDVLGYDDGWRKTAFGQFEVTVRFSSGSASGRYTGHMNYRPVTGRVEAVSYELPPHPPALAPLASGEHPRLLFRESDLPMLREKARTDAGKKMLTLLRRGLAAEKTLYRVPLQWDSNWEPGCHAAMGQGFLSLLFDDASYGRRVAPLIMDRSRTPPYGGEHGERMPTPMSHFPYAVDLTYRLLTPEERKEVIEGRCWLPSLYNRDYGPLGVIAANRGVFGVPGLAALAMVREKGEFTLREPEPVPAVVTLVGQAGLASDRAEGPVNTFVAGHMPSNWLVAGPFPVAPGVDPLAAIGGCAAAKPRLDMSVPVGGGERKFRPLSPSAIKVLPPPFPRIPSIELPVSEGEQFFLYAILEVEANQGIVANPTSPTGPSWSDLWIDGRPLSGGAVIALEPGLHRLLVATRAGSCSPTFHPVNTRWRMAERRRYEMLRQRWEDARKRHAETGEVQDVAAVFDLLRQSIRTSLWFETQAALSGKKRRGIVGFNSWFSLACRAATGQGLDPDVPRPFLTPGESLGDVGGDLDMVATDSDLVFMLGLAPEALLPEVVREFDRRIAPERFARLSTLEKIVAFVNYPVGLPEARWGAAPARDDSPARPPIRVSRAGRGASGEANRAADTVKRRPAVALPVPAPAPLGDPGTIGFRNDGSGRFQGTVADRFDIASGEGIRWKVPLPDYGVSSPIVVKDLAIVTCDPDAVMAFSMSDGAQVWSRGIGVSPVLGPAHEEALRDACKWVGAAPAFPQYMTPRVRIVDPRNPDTDWTPEAGLGWSVATPVSDGANVWAVGYRGAVGCIGTNGEVRWKTFVPDTCKGSPCLVGGHLIVTGTKSVFALDPATGTNRWRRDFRRIPGKAATQLLKGTTPAVWRSRGRAILVWPQGLAMDAADGADVSGILDTPPDNGPCFLAGDRMVVRYTRWRRDDAPPADGVPPEPWQLVAWDMTLADGKLKLEKAWEYPPYDRFMEIGPGQAFGPGMLLAGDALVRRLGGDGAAADGVVAVNWADGAEKPTGCGLPRAAGAPYWCPSPAMAGDRLVFADADGTVTIVDARSLPWKVLSRTSVATAENRGKTGFVMGASPFISGDRMLLRTSRELICVGPK